MKGLPHWIQVFIMCHLIAWRLRGALANTAAIMLRTRKRRRVVVPDAGYLKAVRELCTRRDIMLILMKLQTGIRRTGTMFAYQH